MSDWKSSASIKTLKARAELLSLIRQFFSTRDIFEVETPLLCRHGVTDRYMKSFKVEGFAGGDGFLQTSPEYAMKRLLASGSGSIYQICKSFRQDELGERHNPEFTMLEWYCVDFDHWQLMGQVFELLEELAKAQGMQLKRRNLSYREAFLQYLKLDPFAISHDELSSVAHNKLGDLPPGLERDDMLALLFEAHIEPFIGLEGEVCFITDYPASQAALARLDSENPEVCCRFEVYWEGVELANGFYELSDPEEQLNRFEKDNKLRKLDRQTPMAIDQHLIDALKHGLPMCSGVALGLDRLFMILLRKAQLQDVLTFPVNRA
ncbi:EF-P lysine aminoacylase EpmA [Kangiella sediminilitoris]|uniref:Lysyl-tRNA synthetase-related protein GenX n=1 Tax=Kangiella sediminilitoris TaxID=1144748 RepID=A0A1B3B907_9GAMM|nr:EF-P lysine aminoacylase EpmA [Kangiella sediminilitoris]AOE49287.1 Lysyl-tRNA synthetase-related protein GenX [Kangiella sediminilitoris]